ncbi:unnamed protein product [Miscanthus lutarioriparius]|uniref:Noc2p family n=1 Tax=Miscanthus lutarioriparius TaxID=422564 RepID=A0A811QQY2_9POAL|nr:unnamed protein product [Miscanthus lutarioriparius]
MAKKLGKKARKFARKNLQSAAKRNRKIRNQFNHRRGPRRGESLPPTLLTCACLFGCGRAGREDGDEDVPQRVHDSTMVTNDEDATLIHGLEFPDDDAELDADLSDSDGYLSEDPGCPYYSDSEDEKADKDCILEDGLDRQNDDMNRDIKKQKKKLKKLLDKDPEFANFLEKWQSELESYRSKEDSDEDGMDSMDDDDDSNDGNSPNAKILFRLWASGDQSLSLSAFLMIREVASLLPDCLDLCLTKSYNTYLASTKLVNDRNTKHIYFLIDCLVELYSLDVQKSYERAVTSVEQLNAILRQASKTKEKEDLRKIDNWQYINCVNLWVRFLCCHYKDYNLHPLFSEVLQVIRGVAHLFRGTRYLPLRLRLVQMLNELSSCSQMFYPIPSLLFDCLEFREVSQKEQTQRTKINFSSLLKVPKNLLKSRDFQEECVLSAIQVLSAHFAQWSYHVSFPEVATIPLFLLKKLHEQTTIEPLHRPIKRLIDQVTENKDFIERKREVVSFSPNDKASVDSFLQEEKVSRNTSFTRFYASVAENCQPKGNIVQYLINSITTLLIYQAIDTVARMQGEKHFKMPREFLRAIWNWLASK